jgi:hypothetical protein
MTTNREGIDAYVIKALGRERDQLRDELKAVSDDAVKTIRELRAENERLRAALAANHQANDRREPHLD